MAQDEGEQGSDPWVIPKEWEQARPYFERRLETRRREVDRRDMELNHKLSILSEQVTITKEELHGIRDGVRDLNGVFQNMAEQNKVLVDMVSQEGITQIARWETYEEEQRAQGAIIREDHRLNKREDRTRFPMRLATIGLLMIILFVLVVEKAGQF
jgi:hypothetical protein